jgi:hypothetical protein
MFVTVIFADETWSAETNASSNSLPNLVEKAEVLTVLLGKLWSPEAVASIATAPYESTVEKKPAINKKRGLRRNVRIFILIYL